MRTLIIFFILSMVLFSALLYGLLKQYRYNYGTWYQCTKNDKINSILQASLVKGGLERVPDSTDMWDVYLPCGKYGETAFKNVPVKNKHQMISFISGSGTIGSKVIIWRTLVNFYGREKASTIMPRSYIFPDDLEIFKKDYNTKETYMMKSEAQRQTGLKLSNNYDEIINSKQHGYKIVQKYLGNALTYKNHKLNFRVYLLIVCDGYSKKAYIYNDGIISYAKGESDYNINNNSGISSFYTSKELYQQNWPIILSQLIKVMKYDWVNLQKQFIDQTNKLMKAASFDICKTKLKYNNKTFQIFGMDFIVSNDKAYILEVNIGPGMNPYSKIDGKMRNDLFEDILSMVGITDSKDKNISNFIRVF